MSKASDEFYVQLRMDQAKIACKNAVAQLGWRIMEDKSNRIVCKEVASQMTSFTNPAEVAVCLIDCAEKTKIILNGSVLGFGPIQSNHIQGQMGRIKI